MAKARKSREEKRGMEQLWKPGAGEVKALFIFSTWDKFIIGLRLFGVGGEGGGIPCHFVFRPNRAPCRPLNKGDPE